MIPETLSQELCQGGDLSAYVAANGSLDEESLAAVASQVLRTVKNCHEHNILHGESVKDRLQLGQIVHAQEEHL